MPNLRDDEIASTFRAPRTLEVTPLRIERILLIGQCVLQPLIAPIEERLSPGTRVDFILFNHAVDLPELPAGSPGAYDFQLVSLPLRIMIPETLYLGLAYSDVAGIERLFEDACGRLDMILELALKWNNRHGLLTFVANFFVPQQNPNGRLFPRYDLRNMVFFIERLNQHLASRVSDHCNAYLVDFDAIAASFGRRRVQDDALWIHSHGSILYDHDINHDAHRLAPPPRAASVEFRLETEAFIGEVWHELIAMVRTLRQIDPVKMVIVDLDDTLWRGVLAEQEFVHKADAEGWPLGVVEALMYLKRRGVILAIASKNEESAVARIFRELYDYRIHLSDFALKRINWNPKPETVAQLLEEANLLPRNVVFIDDNPVERDAVSKAFPTMRILGASLYAIRRDLLWSAETQVTTITHESESRTDTVRAQVQREGVRKVMSRETFLASLDVALTLFEIEENDAGFARAFELLNKTNQFNTTGQRWRDEALRDHLTMGLRMVAFSVKDRFADYGLVGLVLIEEVTIVQLVMSCRVLGLDVEASVVKHVADQMRASGTTHIEACFVETNANVPCRALYPKCGFTQTKTGWIAALDAVTPGPTHVATSVAFRGAAAQHHRASLDKDRCQTPSPAAHSEAMPAR